MKLDINFRNFSSTQGQNRETFPIFSKPVHALFLGFYLCKQVFCHAYDSAPLSAGRWASLNLSFRHDESMALTHSSLQTFSCKFGGMP